MAEPLRDANSVQKLLNEFQDTQRQLQIIAAQRQQMIMQLEEVKMADEELVKCEKGIYRSVGPLLLETTKAEAQADLKEKRELFDMRLSVLEKQEAKLKPRFLELRELLEKMMRENRSR